MVSALSKLVSFSDKLVYTLCLHVFPELLKLTILSIFIICKQYRLLKSKYHFKSAIHNNTAIFMTYNHHHHRHPYGDGECCICLSELVEGQEGMELVQCRHSFHRHCLEKWLDEYTGATCPLCNSVVVPEAVLLEYKKVQVEQNDDAMEKELALVLLTAIDTRTCNGFSF